MCQVKRRSFLGSAAALVGGSITLGRGAHGQNHSQESAAGVRHHSHAV